MVVPALNGGGCACPDSEPAPANFHDSITFSFTRSASREPAAIHPDRSLTQLTPCSPILE